MTKSRKDFVRGYREALQEIGTINDATMRILVDVYDQSLFEWEVEIVERLYEKVKEWEQMMDVADERLYSLGLRHAIDIVRGEEVDPLAEANGG